MIVLDTDHLTVHAFPESESYKSLRRGEREKGRRGEWEKGMSRTEDLLNHLLPFSPSHNLPFSSAANLGDFRHVPGLRVENGLA